MTFELRRRDDDDGLCFLEVHGDLDLATAPVLRDELRTILDGSSRGLVLDLEEVGFLDSTGLGVLVAAYKRAGSLGVPLMLARPQRMVANALTLARIDTVIPVHASIEEAAAHAAGSATAP